MKYIEWKINTNLKLRNQSFLSLLLVTEPCSFPVGTSMILASTSPFLESSLREPVFLEATGGNFGALPGALLSLVTTHLVPFFLLLPSSTLLLLDLFKLIEDIVGSSAYEGGFTV